MANSISKRYDLMRAKAANGADQKPASAPAPAVEEAKKPSFFNFKPIESEIPSEEKSEEAENEENN